MTTVRKVKRIKRKINKPNPLFEKWLTEWKEEAAARGSKMQYCFAKALHSLKKYPLPLNSGKECCILQNFGTRLCIMIDRKLAEYKSSNVEDGLPQNIDVADRTYLQQNKVDSCGSKSKKRNSQSAPKSRQTPQTASMNFDYRFLLVTLLNESQQTGCSGLLSKSELVSKTEMLYHESTMSKDFLPDMTTLIDTLITSGLIVCELNNYRLSEEGTEAAISHVTKFPELLNSLHSPVSNRVTKNPNHQNKGKKLPAKKKVNRLIQEKNVDVEKLDDDVALTFSGNKLAVVLLVDTAETSGKPRDDTVSTLNSLGTEFEVRHLKVGDFAWIIRDLQTGSELVLPYIVERKRIDDLSKSIMDGRFHEQKFRLKKCGVQNLIYLVESHKHDNHAGLLLSTLQQAAINTQIVDGFTVKYTDNHHESMVYLATLSDVFKRKLNHKIISTCRKESLPNFSINDDVIHLMTFAEFSKVAKKKKNFKVKEIFMKQLLQLYGLSVEKASAVTKLYPTPRLLFDALHAEDGAELLSNVSYGLTSRRVGPVISKAVHLLYTSKF